MLNLPLARLFLWLAFVIPEPASSSALKISLGYIKKAAMSIDWEDRGE